MTNLPPVPIAVRTLANDLTVATVHLPHLHLGYAALFVRGGPRFEDSRSHGLSHFCEHMLFRGAGRFGSAVELARAIEDVGGHLDAATYRDHLVYASLFAPRGLGRVLEVIAALVREPAFSDIEVERRIILEELNELEDGRGREIDPDNVLRSVQFGSHPLGQRIDGSRQGLQRFSRRDLRRHHGRHYGARNAVLVIAGPDAPASMARQARRHLGSLPAGQRLPLGALPAPGVARPKLRFVDEEGSQTDLRLGWVVPGEKDALAPVLAIARRLLDDGVSSRLQDELVEQRGLAYELWAELDQAADIGVFDLGAVVAHRKVASTVRALLESLARLAQEGPSPDELRRAKRRALWSFEAAVDAPHALAEWVGRGLLFDLNIDVACARAQIQGVRGAQVRGALRRLLAPSCVHLVAVGKVRPRERQRVARVIEEAAAQWPG
ncbi:MAG: pitrilysin family protein [Pseudomonadota bacterium]